MINLKTDEDSYQKLHGAMTQSVTIRDPKSIIDKVVADDGSEVFKGGQDKEKTVVRLFTHSEKPMLTVTLKKKQ